MESKMVKDVMFHKDNWIGLHRRLNGAWQTYAMLGYLLIVLGHTTEHILQVMQAFVLDWSRADSLGMLGLYLPQLVRSEWLHFGYNTLQLAGLLLLAAGLSGRARTWWKIAIVAQMWHFFEHSLLLAQYTTGVYLFGASRQTSVGELFFQRIELHFAYVVIVAVPTLVAMTYYFRQGAARTKPGYETSGPVPARIG